MKDLSRLPRLRDELGRREDERCGTNLESVASEREIFDIIKDQMDTMIGEVVCDCMLGLVIQFNDSSFTDIIGEHGLFIRTHCEL
jgi:hypothetical protein